MANMSGQWGHTSGTGSPATTPPHSTVIPQHPGDIPTGTLRKIQKDLEPALGRKGLL